MLRTLVAATAAFAFLLLGARAHAIGVALPPSFAAELETQFLAAATADPQLQALTAEAIAKSKKASFKDFLSVVRFCAMDQGQAARVSDSSQEAITYLTRELGEPEDADENALRNWYAARAAQSLPKESYGLELKWTFNPDIVVVRTVQTKREICVDASRTAADGIEYLAHEMIHFSRASDLSTRVDPLAYADAADYAKKTALEPGDEVDAYLFEYSLRVRRHGKAGLDRRPFPQAHFNDRGEYAGTREEFARFVVDDLGYLKSRFAPQYKKLAASDAKISEQMLGLERDMLSARAQQAKEYGDFVRSRFGLVDKVWKSYRDESAKGRRFLRGAEASRDRLEEDIARLEKRIEALNARLKSI